LTSGAESGVHASCARCCSRCSSGRRAGEAGGLMSEAAVAESVTIAAVPERVGLARAFVAGILGESHPCNDLAVLLASELVTNSVQHSGSAVPGGLVTVAVVVGEGSVRIEVTDRSGGGAPVLSPAAFADGDAEGSRGLGLVDELAARWATSGAAGSRRRGSSYGLYCNQCIIPQCPMSLEIGSWPRSPGRHPARLGDPLLGDGE
jgi:anti-sigma regulatory factor (Ser/Thr protein kinase)